MDLKLGNNQFSGCVPDIFGKFANIKWLDLSNNNLSGTLDETPSLFTRMNLTTLLLDHNLFTGSIPESIRNLTSLFSLSLAHNQFTGPIPATLSSITFIKHIVLNNNLLCGPIPASLIHLTSLTTLRLQGNKLTGPLPPEFGGMMRLRLLDISHNPGIIGSLSTKFGRDPKKKDEVDTRALKELLLNGTGMDVAKNGNMLLDKYVAHKVQHNHMQVKRVCKTKEGGRCVECEEARVKNEERGNGENLVDLE
ncbi:L domain-like protein [Rhizoclosmatium globosum]|uniref:L domain-like protein n=1 Tax=Rhizoclosmatium globosum TaxID=329046 RepID=A0A1Y2CGD7_9FUNG|nr:L domain-like protein [Rhizoclosmatium globosum]|eukprot:ORY46111.1 L domain-like protein [Rhizoclosmatium globosum]